MALIEWAHLQVPAVPALNTLVYIANDAKRSPAAAGIAKAMGLRAGVWDYLLAFPREVRYPLPARGMRIYNGLWIEFKSPNDKLSKEQKWWGELMREAGYATHVSRTWPNAAETIKAYIDGKDWERCWQ